MRRRTTAPIAAIAALVMLAACMSEPKQPGAAPATSAAAPTPTSTLTQEEAKAGEQALAAYNAYREYVVTAMTIGKYKREEMVKFLGEPRLGSQINALASQIKAGVTFQGRPTWSPQVSDIDLTTVPPVVTIDDCYDVTNFIPYRKGKPVPGPTGAATRFDIEMKVIQVDGVWYVSEDVSPKGQTC